MADEKKGNGRKNIHTGYKGTFKEGSFSMDTSGEKPVAKATLVLEGDKGFEKEVRGRGLNADKLKDAFEAGGTQILHGQLFGGKEGYLSAAGFGPKEIKGKISHIQTNIDNVPEGKTPYINAFISDRGMGGNGNRIPGVPVLAFGDEAMAFKGVNDGDTVAFGALERQEAKKDREGNQVKDDDGRPVFQTIARVEGNVSFEPTPEAAPEEDDTPTP